MVFTPVFSNANLSIDYDAYRNCLFLTLHDQPERTVLQDITLKGRALCTATDYPARCLVLDNMTLTGTDTINWLVDWLLPSLYRAGVRHCHWVYNPTIRSYQLAEQVAKRLPSIELIIFGDLEHAVTWLWRAKAS